jgi:hypothetical protein
MRFSLPLPLLTPLVASLLLPQTTVHTILFNDTVDAVAAIVNALQNLLKVLIDPNAVVMGTIPAETTVLFNGVREPLGEVQGGRTRYSSRQRI